MGWLFGKKKEAKVPFPTGHQVPPEVSRDTLHFSAPSQRDRVIQPQRVQEAVGRPIPPQPNVPQASPQPVQRVAHPRVSNLVGGDEGEPLYIKINVYQVIIDTFGDLGKELLNFKQIGKHLEKSEENEEQKIVKLKRSIKSVHDNLLEIDQKIFNM
jgi:hypothetical protein